MSRYILAIVCVFIACSCSSPPPNYQDIEEAIALASEQILVMERMSLDHWSSGDPLGYAIHVSDDATYFDDIGAIRRVDGKEALQNYLSSLEGQISVHKYEIVNSKVQVYGDVGILTFYYEPSSLDGEADTPWRATSVYHRIDGEWQMVHAHWSLFEEE